MTPRIQPMWQILISQGKCLFYEYPPMALRELRSLLFSQETVKKARAWIESTYPKSSSGRLFPEFDQYYRQSYSQGLAIVRWCLAPSVIAGLNYDEFVRLVAPRTRTIGQRDRLKGDLEESN